MAQTFSNLRIWLGFAVLAVLLMLMLTGSLGAADTGPVCTEVSAPGGPGFTALPSDAAPACLRIRIG